MNDAKRTPGKFWTWEPGTTDIFMPSGRRILCEPPQNLVDRNGESDAIKKLVKAVNAHPAILKALDGLLSVATSGYVEGLYRQQGDSAYLDKVVKAARAALPAAPGEVTG